MHCKPLALRHAGQTNPFRMTAACMHADMHIGARRPGSPEIHHRQARDRRRPIEAQLVAGRRPPSLSFKSPNWRRFRLLFGIMHRREVV